MKKLSLALCCLFFIVLSMTALGQQAVPNGYIGPVASVALGPDGLWHYLSVSALGGLVDGGGTGTSTPGPLGYQPSYAPVALNPSGVFQYLNVDINGNLLVTSGSGGGGSANFPYPGPVCSTSASAGTVCSSSQLQAVIGAGVYLGDANNLSDLNSASAARTNLGLGTGAVAAALTTPGNYYIPVSNSTTTFLASLIPACADTSGNHLNDTQASGVITFTCGNTAPVPTAGSIVNSMLANSTLTISGTVCTLGGSCSVSSVPGAASITNTMLVNSTMTISGTICTLGSSCTVSGGGSSFPVTTAGSASTSPMSVTGTLYTGGTATTTYPYFYFDEGATQPTTFSTGGTFMGVNASSGFTTGNFLDLYVNGGNSVFQITATGGVNAASQANFTGGFVGKLFGGTSAATLTAGAAAGTAPTGPSCVTNHACSSFNGTVTLTTGTSTTTGSLMTITNTSTHTKLADCQASIVLTAAPYTASPNYLFGYTTTVNTLNIGTALLASTSYTITYACLGY
jgi:hypothetical protein